jgi:hypothetical protein
MKKSFLTCGTYKNNKEGGSGGVAFANPYLDHSAEILLQSQVVQASQDTCTKSFNRKMKE